MAEVYKVPRPTVEYWQDLSFNGGGWVFYGRMDWPSWSHWIVPGTLDPNL